MRHDITLSDAGFTLRPVTLEDAATIVALRADPEQSQFVHAISPKVSDQENWLTRYFDREGDYYFVVERSHDHRFEGTVGIYDVVLGRAEWGRWFLSPGSLAAPASALLMYRAAFEVLKLSELYCRTVTRNEAVVSFHDSCGLTRAGLLVGAFHLETGPADAVEHRLPVEQWDQVGATLSTQANQIARLINRGAKTGK